MPQSASSVINQFYGRISSLNTTRRKVEGLFDSSDLVRRDVEQVYKGLYMEAYAELEGSLEKLFLKLLTGTIYPTSNRTSPRVTFRSPKVARDVVHGGSNYLDWLPYRYTVKRAEAFFRNGHPFKAISRSKPHAPGLSDYQKIERFVIVRNAITHKSRHAVRLFEEACVQGQDLRQVESTPAGFLRVVFRTNPSETWFELLTSEMVQILRKVCAS